MPTGPTMSGPLPEAISVASASLAPAYGTASKVRWMFGWLELNSSTTFFSTATCSGASPPPRQQYQRMSVTPAAADSDGLPDAAADGDSLAAVDGSVPVLALAGVVLDCELPQALAT